MRKTSLHDECVALGGKIVDFHGWALPIQFEGIVKEHEHTRKAVSVFDCSHMGEFRIRGKDAIDRYNTLVCSNAPGLRVKRCRYGAILNEEGGIIDDAITFRMAEDELYVVTNAGPLDKISPLITQDNPGAEDVSDATSKIDVQGPQAREVVTRVGIEAAMDLKYYQACWTRWKGTDIVLARLGYTGELGYEIYVPNEIAVPLWRAILDVDGVKPAGLGARDTLRTEVGFALSGQDFDESNTPLQIGIEKLVDWDGDFRGLDALKKQRENGGYSVLFGIKSPDRRAPRHDFELKENGTVVGKVTSGTYGPSVGAGVGLGYLPQRLAKAGNTLTAGPRDLPVETVDMPAYTEGTSRA